MLLKLDFLLATLLFPAYPLLAQGSGFVCAPSEYEFEYMPIRSQADFGTFNDAAEDKEGFLWLSGTNGINVFDGRNLISYNNQSEIYSIKRDSSIENYWVMDQDDKGLIYVQEIESSGVICFDPRKRKLLFELRAHNKTEGRLQRISPIPRCNEFFSLSIDQCRSTFHIGRCKADGTTVNLFNGRINSFYKYYLQAAGGHHWFINDRSIVRITDRDNTLKTYCLPSPDAHIIQAYSDGDHIYLLDKETRFIYCWNAAKDCLEIYVRLPAALHNQQVLFALDKKSIYIGNTFKFYIMDRSGKRYQDLSPELTAEIKSKNLSLTYDLSKIMITRDGDVLLITQKCLYRLKHKQPSKDLFLQKMAFGKQAPWVLSLRGIAEDEQGNIYAAYYPGVVIKKKEQNIFTPFPVPVHFLGPKSGTYSLNCWKKKLLWSNVVIDKNSGKYRIVGPPYYGSHTVQYLDHDTLWSYSWFSNILSCYALNTQKERLFHLDSLLGTPGKVVEEVTAITGDGSGRYLWMAAKGYGIVLVSKDGRLIRTYNHRSLGLEHEYEPKVNALLINSEGIWYGCNRGLCLLNPVTGKRELFSVPFVDENANMHFRNIFSIVTDTRDNFYLGSNYGLLYFDTHKKVFYTLPLKHPLATVEFNRSSAFRTADGRYYFGGINGLYAFSPEQLSFQEASRPTGAIKINSISFFNKRERKYRYWGACIRSGATLKFEQLDNDIDIHFSVPEFQRNVYCSYRLQGSSTTKWIPCHGDNEISLPNLSTGKHILEIKAATDLNGSYPSYYRLILIVDPVWYKKLWVIILFGLTGVMFIILAMRYRFNQKVLQQERLAMLRGKISSDLHDDVGSVLSGLAMQSEMLTYTAPEEQKEPLKEISIMSRSAMDSMRDIVWAMDSRKDKYEDLIDRMKVFAERVLSATNIELEFIVKDIYAEKFIDPEKRQNIYLIFKEALTNSMRHAACSKVHIQFIRQGGELQLIIHDNGTQIPASVVDGLGLSNMKMRAEKINGTLRTSYNKGFKVELYLKISPNDRSVT